MTETTTTAPVPQPATLKRCAILGTALSWTQCPFDDKTLEVWGLNDGYLLGQPRAERWFDLHPFHQMHFRPQGERTVNQAEVPVGVYLRPAGHLEWLKTRPMPVFLAEKRPDYPTSQTFPKDQLLEWFKPLWPLRLSRGKTIQPGPDYEVSTPSWMLMLAIAEGYQEIHIYGIHLATQWEYVQQRPNFEFLLGIAAGRGIKVVLPDASPICRASYRYAFEKKADLPEQEATLAINLIKQEGAQLRQRMAKLPWYAHAEREDIKTRLRHLDVLLADNKQIHSRAQIAALV